MPFDPPVAKPPRGPRLPVTAKIPLPQALATAPEAQPLPNPDAVNPAEELRTTYKQLSRASIDLNAASDALAKPIEVWEAALKKLNLGVSAWVELSSSGQDSWPYWWDRSVGYTKLKDSWGIALIKRSGSEANPGDDIDEEISPFNEAPRWMRLEGISKLPGLLAALLKEAENTTKQIKAKIEHANELAEAIGRVADEILSEGK